MDFAHKLVSHQNGLWETLFSFLVSHYCFFWNSLFTLSLSLMTICEKILVSIFLIVENGQVFKMILLWMITKLLQLTETANYLPTDTTMSILREPGLLVIEFKTFKEVQCWYSCHCTNPWWMARNKKCHGVNISHRYWYTYGNYILCEYDDQGNFQFSLLQQWLFAKNFNLQPEIITS